jgi:glycosyltransferase involved in cell wall biosynthesis
MLRFCMLTTFYPPHNFGGDGIGVQRLSRALVRRGHRVTVVHDADAYASLAPGPVAEVAAEDDGVEVVPLRSGLGTLSPLLTQQLGRPVVNGARLRRLLSAGSYDVIMFHNTSLVGGPGLLSYGEGIKLYEAHEHWLVCPTHVLWRHGREPCDARECLRCVLSYRRPPQMWRYTGLLERQLRHVDGFIAKSEFSRRKHAEFGFSREMQVIPYFLPDTAGEDAVAEAGGAGSPPNGGRPYFLFVGRLERIKGLDDVIPAMASHPEADLLIAGDGEYGARLRELGRSVPNVRFLGRIAPEALRSLYAGAIALVVPSVCYETFGIILIEAFRQGTPVLARRIGPFPEIVEAGGGGLLFDAGSELPALMRQLQQEPALRTRLAVAARASFARYWTEDAVVPRYLDLINECAIRRGRGDIVERLTSGSVA